MTKAAVTVMYVSKLSIRIALLITVLNDCKLKLGSSLNAYVQEPLWVLSSAMMPVRLQ